MGAKQFARGKRKSAISDITSRSIYFIFHCLSFKLLKTFNDSFIANGSLNIAHCQLPIAH
jgi:hypothetical protein